MALAYVRMYTKIPSIRAPLFKSNSVNIRS
jgi:hypothetical protein